MNASDFLLCAAGEKLKIQSDQIVELLEARKKRIDIIEELEIRCENQRIQLINNNKCIVKKNKLIKQLCKQGQEERKK